MASRFGWLSGGRWMRYAWLIYVLPFAGMGFEPHRHWTETAATLAASAVFLVLYFRATKVRGPKAFWFVAAYDLIAFAFSGRNPGAVSFWIFGAAELSRVRPFRLALFGLLAQLILVCLSLLVHDLPYWYWIPGVLASALIGGVTIQGAVNDERNASLRLAQDEVARLAKVAERERIARDVHDVLGHTLTLVVIKSQLAQKLLGRDPEAAAREMAEVERTARQGLAEVRDAITGYRAPAIAVELEQASHAVTSAGITPRVDAPAVALGAAQESALSLALREATTNVIRHAGATECRIQLRVRDGAVVMEVHDNGRGGDAPFGNGLTGMRERILALGGRLDRETSQGTRLQIALPLTEGVRA